MLDHPHQKPYFQFVGNFHNYLHVKNQLHHHFVLTILQRYANLLFCVFGACLAMHTYNESITHFFLEILHFKKSWNLIG